MCVALERFAVHLERSMSLYQIIADSVLIREVSHSQSVLYRQVPLYSVFIFIHCIHIHWSLLCVPSSWRCGHECIK